MDSDKAVHSESPRVDIRCLLTSCFEYWRYKHSCINAQEVFKNPMYDLLIFHCF